MTLGHQAPDVLRLDARSAAGPEAALRALAGLSTPTHHRHQAQLAAGLVPGCVLVEWLQNTWRNRK